MQLDTLGSANADLQTETTTIMFADVVESVRLIAQDERANVIRIRTLLLQLATDTATRFGGTVLERRGDGLLMRFNETRQAANCALAFHAECRVFNQDCDSAQTIALRVGIHHSEVLSDHASIYGQGINLAARVASLAGPGETVVSSLARDQLLAGFDADIEDLGECYLKHVPEAIRAFRLGQVGPAPVIPEGAASRLETLPSIAVLGLEAFGLEASQAANLLTETLAHYLSRAGSLTVISWLSSKAISATGIGPKAAGQALKADWVIGGSCRLVGDGILVNAQLIRVSDEVIKHSERISGPVADLLRPECELAASLANAMVHSVTQSEARRVSTHPLPSLSSHSLLLGAVGLMHRSGPADFLRSKGALEHLLERQPRMHSARPWLAKWYVLRTTRGMLSATQDEARRALEQTSRALDSRDDDAFALAIQGFVHFHMLKDTELARKRLEQAVFINPNEPLANVFYAALVSASGQFERAWTLAERALTLSPFDPLRPYMRMIAAACALSSERYEHAVLLARQSLKENAVHAAAWRTLVIGLVQSDQVQEAQIACKSLLSLEPGLTVSAYEKRLSLPVEAKRRAVESLRIAGVPNG